MENKKSYGNLLQFNYNPIQINNETKQYFPNLKHFWIYKTEDNSIILKENELISKNICFETYLNINEKEKIQIEKWTKLKMKEIIFDSKIHNWNLQECNFHEKIFNKQNLLFLIETDENIKFGGFISSKINKYYDWVNDIESISDKNAFIFTFNQNKQLKFDIKKEYWNHSFQLYKKSNDVLFQFGNKDFSIEKEDCNYSFVCQNSKCYFDYLDYENILIGKCSFIKIKSLYVIQMSE